MINNEYLTKMQDNLSRIKEVIRKEYNKLIELSKTNGSLYNFNLQVDELHESIMRLFFYKKQIQK